MSKHADLANRIFRTVVFSGAMLGSAIPALADQQPPPQQGAPAPRESRPAPVKPDTWVSVTREIEATDKKLDVAIGKLVAGYKAKKDGSAPDAALAATVADLRAARAGLDARLAKTTRPAFANEKAVPEVEKTEKALGEAEANLFAAVDTLTAAKEAADVKTAITGVEKARKARTTAVAKVRAARTKANRRPRTPVEDRPVGRGFVLS